MHPYGLEYSIDYLLYCRCPFHYYLCKLVQFIGTTPGNCSFSVEKETKAKRLSIIKDKLHKSTKQIYEDNLTLFPREHCVQSLKMKIEPAHTVDMNTFVEEELTFY